MSVFRHKPYMRRITRRRAGKEEFLSELSLLAPGTDPGAKIADLLNHKGRVYGSYRGKRLVAIYLFERVENYFIPGPDVKINIAGSSIGLKKIRKDLYGEDRAALQLTAVYGSERIDSVERDILSDLKNQIAVGRIAGFAWDNKIFYRRSLYRAEGENRLAGRLFGAALGFIFGIVIFGMDENPIVGVVFGLLYALLYSDLFYLRRRKDTKDIEIYSLREVIESTIEETPDVVNPQYHERTQSEEGD